MIKFDKSMISPQCERLDVAVSMGSDSVALSYFLSKGRIPIRLHYVNHGTPYADKAQEAFNKYSEFLANNSPSMHVTSVVSYKPSEELPFKEADFRDFRYGYFDAFFNQPHIKNKTNQLVVCHHLADAVESYLMSTLTTHENKRILPLETDRGNYKVIRPFILTKKKQIEDFIIRNDLLKWIVVDPSNLDTSIRRNWIRHVLIPLIKTNYPGIEKVVSKIYIKNGKES